MKEDFKNVFQKELDVEVDFGPVMRFSLMRNEPWIKHFIFVEGATDRVFYENTNIQVFSDHAYYYYRMLSDKSKYQEYQGKEAVFYSLKKILESMSLKKDLHRCQFVVDRDYEKTKRSKYVKLKPVDYARVLVTKGHSMESYFIEESNLEKIFRSVGLDIAEFLKLFDDFAEEMSRYYALKAVITNNYTIASSIKYRRKYLDSQLFDFDFSANPFWIGRDKVKEECLRMKRALSQYSYLQKQAESLQKEIKSDRMNVRGHDAFAFLEKYIQQKGHKTIAFPSGDKKELKRMIGGFSVELTH